MTKTETRYECIRIDPGYAGGMFHVGGIYKAAAMLDIPAVIDEYGAVRVIGPGLRFVVGHRPGNLSPIMEIPLFAYFAPAAAGDNQ